MTPLAIEKVLQLRSGEGIAACGRIPEESEFFKDHFPGFPVLPGVLALEMLKQTAEHYLRLTGDHPRRRFSLKQIRAAKFSRYLKPGDEWQSHLELLREEGGRSDWNGRLLHGERVAVSARLTLEAVRVPEALRVS